MLNPILQSYVNEFLQESGLPKLADSVVFEHFVNSCVVARAQPEKFDLEELEAVRVAGRGDLGIDGIAILVNDHVVRLSEEVDYFAKQFRRWDVQFVFTQAKISPHFHCEAIGRFLQGIRTFFQQQLPATANEVIRERHAVKQHVFAGFERMEEAPVCRLFYAAPGEWSTTDQNLATTVGSGKEDLKATGLFKDVLFIPLDADSLMALYREVRHRNQRQVRFERHTILPDIAGIKEAYLGILPCSEYVKLLVSDTDNALNRAVFYENVRDFLGQNEVNEEIDQTLKEPSQGEKFVLLNNGVTIICREMTKVGAMFNLRDFQVVNGCQTSHILYRNRERLTEKICLPVKLIVTDDMEVMGRIVWTTNRQTPIPAAALQSLLPFQRKLEEFYAALAKDAKEPLYYERRHRQYEYLGVANSRIVSLGAQVRAFAGMFLNDPHSLHRNYEEYLNTNREHVFVENHSAWPYYVSGLGAYVIGRLFKNGVLDWKWRPLKYHLLFLFRLLTQKGRLPYLNLDKAIEHYCKPLILVLEDEKESSKVFQRSIGYMETALKKGGYDARAAARLRSFTEDIKALVGVAQAPAATAQRVTGTVKSFSDIHGYGFIVAKGYAKDIFVHWTQIRGESWQWRTLTPGQNVEFNAVQVDRGIEARDVALTNK